MGHQQQDSNRALPAIMLIPIAVLHSHLFWFCSVVWTFCTQLSTETLSAQHVCAQEPPPVLPTNTDVKRRRRGYSEPPTPKPSLCELEPARPRCTTMSAGTTPSVTGCRHRFLRSLHLPLDVDNQLPLRPTTSDERQGSTVPPLWWQKTRFYLDAIKHHSISSSSSFNVDHSWNQDSSSSFDTAVEHKENVSKEIVTIAPPPKQVPRRTVAKPKLKKNRRKLPLVKAFSRRGDKNKTLAIFTQLWSRVSRTLKRKK